MGLFLAGAAALGFGLYQALTRRALRHLGALDSTFIQVVIGAVLGSVIVGCAGDFPDSRGALVLGSVWFALAGLLNWGAGVALLSLSQRRIGAVKTAPLTAATPLFGMAIGVPLLGEIPTTITLVGTAVMIIGVAIPPARQGLETQSAVSGAPVYTRTLPGLATAFCFALTAIFVRKGLDYADPLFGVWISMVVVVVVYALIFIISRRPVRTSLPWPLLSVELGAAALVTLSTWIFWAGIGNASVGAVLAISLVQIPTAILATPFIAGRSGEEWTRRSLASAALVVVGGLLVLLFSGH